METIDSGIHKSLVLVYLHFNQLMARNANSSLGNLWEFGGDALEFGNGSKDVMSIEDFRFS